MIEINWENKQLTLFRWLVIAALIEWLIVRTVTRAAIHIPKSSAVISIYQAVNMAGQVAGAFVALLALVLMGWIAHHEWQTRQVTLFPLALFGLVVLSLTFLVIVPSAWLAAVYHLLGISVVALIGRMMIRTSSGYALYNRYHFMRIVAFLLPAMALLMGILYQFWPTLYTTMGWSGPPLLTGVLFNLGEVLVVLSVVLLWWVYGRTTSGRIWLWAIIPPLLFTMSFQRDPAMTGILTIWSTGLTLFLPWLVYALALWLAGVTILATWRTLPAMAYALLLLISAGYAPQLSSQLFCALIALWLLTQVSYTVASSQHSVLPLPNLELA